MSTRTYSVEGMSCEHCVAAITGEVRKIPDVSALTVDLATNTVTVIGDPLDDAAVAAAIDEAGSTLID